MIQNIFSDAKVGCKVGCKVGSYQQNEITAEMIVRGISAEDIKKIHKNLASVGAIHNRMTLHSAGIFTVPTTEMISELSKYLNKHSRGVVSVGAGLGLTEYLLSKQLKIPLLACDNGNRAMVGAAYYKVDRCEYAQIDKYIGDSVDTIMFGWPEMDLDYVQNSKFKYLVYIGEAADGATGSKQFHKFLKAKRYVEIPYLAWAGMHDYCRVYKLQK